MLFNDVKFQGRKLSVLCTVYFADAVKSDIMEKSTFPDKINYVMPGIGQTVNL